MNLNGVNCAQVGEVSPSHEGNGEDRMLEQQELGASMWQRGQGCSQGPCIPKILLEGFSPLHSTQGNRSYHSSSLHSKQARY